MGSGYPPPSLEHGSGLRQALVHAHDKVSCASAAALLRGLAVGIQRTRAVGSASPLARLRLSGHAHVRAAPCAWQVTWLMIFLIIMGVVATGLFALLIKTVGS